MAYSKYLVVKIFTSLFLDKEGFGKLMSTSKPMPFWDDLGMHGVSKRLKSMIETCCVWDIASLKFVYMACNTIALCGMHIQVRLGWLKPNWIPPNFIVDLGWGHNFYWRYWKRRMGSGGLIGRNELGDWATRLWWGEHRLTGDIDQWGWQ